MFVVAPVINIPNQLVGTPLNTEVQIECHVEAFPNAIHYWIRNKEVIMNRYDLLQRLFRNVRGLPAVIKLFHFI